MPSYIDTHAHLCDPRFADDLEAVLDRAVAHGVRSIVAVGETLADGERTLAISRRYPMIRPAVGLYPGNADREATTALEAWIREHRTELCAIGEVGLDFWLAKEEPAREVQREVFARFIDLARELDLPLNVHSRSAGRHAVQMLLDHGAQRVQMHAFDGKLGAALPAVEAGYFFSVPPSIVRSRQKQKLVKGLPCSCLLLETDSPVLGPSPGARNEPANIGSALAAIASIKGLPVEEIAMTIYENTVRLYGQRVAEPTTQQPQSAHSPTSDV